MIFKTKFSLEDFVYISDIRCQVVGIRFKCVLDKEIIIIYTVKTQTDKIIYINEQDLFAFNKNCGNIS